MTEIDIYGFQTKHQKRDVKQYNARIEKWREMIKNWDKVSPDFVKKRVRKGVPEGMRLLVWPILANVNQIKAQAKVNLQRESYQQFLKEKNYEFEHQIHLDVNRTFPENQNFQDFMPCTQSLVNVLKALSIACPELGYCQGMNFLTASLIITTNDESVYNLFYKNFIKKKAFWILYSLMTRYDQKEKYINPVKLNENFYILDRLMYRYLPDMRLICIRNNIDMFYFCTEWYFFFNTILYNRFLTLFSSILPINIFYRVFEIYLVEGEKTLYRCALSLLNYKRNRFMKLQTFEEQLQHLRRLDDMIDIDENQFINEMLTKYTFSRTFLQQCSTEYKNKKQ